MKKLWILALILGMVPNLWAEFPPTFKLPRPYFLQSRDTIPNDSLISPDAPAQGSNGRSMDSVVNIQPPGKDSMGLFYYPPFLGDLWLQKNDETQIQRYYWHSTENLTYCHYKDTEGNNWYGWTDGDGNFNWVLWEGHHFWWRDTFAGHWLYYYQGCWWRGDGQKRGRIQVYLDGNYYACDIQGNVLRDMGQDGNGAIVSLPGVYQGDFQSANYQTQPASGQDHDGGHHFSRASQDGGQFLASKP